MNSRLICYNRCLPCRVNKVDAIVSCFRRQLSTSATAPSGLRLDRFSQQCTNFFPPQCRQRATNFQSSDYNYSSGFLRSSPQPVLNASGLFCQTIHTGLSSWSSLSSSSSSSSSSPLSISKTSDCKTSFEKLHDSMLTLRCGEELRILPYVWLRDHCRCPSCYNYDTSQKMVYINPMNAGQDVLSVGLQDNDENLVIHWKDGHVSKYSVDWLMKNSYNPDGKPTVEKILWDTDTIEAHGVPSVSFKSHTETEGGLRETLRNLYQFGFSCIVEAPVSLEGTQAATSRVAPVQQTLFGGMWEFTADKTRSDTAYDTGYLAAHTDTTYLEYSIGLQVFQCLHHDGPGGETLLVDGFHAIEQLQQVNPQAVRCLSKHVIPHEYKELPTKSNASPGYHMHTLHPVIKKDPVTGEPLHLRFNPYDRAPLNTILPEQIEEFYESYHLLSKTIADPKGQFWIKLRPGTILLIDNWRVMHGRASFEGKRVMCGCYLPRDEWKSALRMIEF